jgi:hypothetical protein
MALHHGTVYKFPIRGIVCFEILFNGCFLLVHKDRVHLQPLVLSERQRNRFAGPVGARDAIGRRNRDLAKPPLDYPEPAAAILQAEGDLLVDLDRGGRWSEPVDYEIGSAEEVVLVFDLFRPLTRYVADIGDAQLVLWNGAKRQPRYYDAVRVECGIKLVPDPAPHENFSKLRPR